MQEWKWFLLVVGELTVEVGLVCFNLWETWEVIIPVVGSSASITVLVFLSGKINGLRIVYRETSQERSQEKVQ